MKTETRNLLLGACVGAAVVLSVAATKPENGWNYRVVHGDVYRELEGRINQAALEGWEVVSASNMQFNEGFAVLRRERQ